MTRAAFTFELDFLETWALSIQPEFPKRGQPRDVYPNFLKNSIQLCSRNFRLNGSHFENLTGSRTSFRKLFREISVPFPAVSKFSKVLVKWKALHVTNTHPLLAKVEYHLLIKLPLVNHKTRRNSNGPIRYKIKHTCPGKARESACDQLTTGRDWFWCHSFLAVKLARNFSSNE